MIHYNLIALLQSFINSSTLICLATPFLPQNMILSKAANRVYCHSAFLSLNTLSFFWSETDQSIVAGAQFQNQATVSFCHLIETQNPSLLFNVPCRGTWKPKSLDNCSQIWFVYSHVSKKWDRVSPPFKHKTQQASLSGKILCNFFSVCIACFSTSKGRRLPLLETTIPYPFLRQSQTLSCWLILWLLP